MKTQDIDCHKSAVFHGILVVTDGSEVFTVEFPDEESVEGYKLKSLQKFQSKKVRLYCIGEECLVVHDAEKNAWHVVVDSGNGFKVQPLQVNAAQFEVLLSDQLMVFGFEAKSKKTAVLYPDSEGVIRYQLLPIAYQKDKFSTDFLDGQFHVSQETCEELYGGDYGYYLKGRFTTEKHMKKVVDKANGLPVEESEDGGNQEDYGSGGE